MTKYSMKDLEKYKGATAPATLVRTDDELAVYLQEIVALGTDMAASTQRYKEILAARKEQGPQLANSPAFVAAQSMLTIGALVSKMLLAPPLKPKWCSCDAPEEDQEKHRRAVARAKALRKALKLKQVPELLNNRVVRNHIEHFDDRLDTWVAEGPHTATFDRMITPIDLNEFQDTGAGKITFSDHNSDLHDDPRVLRQIITSTETIRVLDDSVNLIQLAVEVLEVAQRARDYLNSLQ